MNTNEPKDLIISMVAELFVIVSDFWNQPAQKQLLIPLLQKTKNFLCPIEVCGIYENSTLYYIRKRYMLTKAEQMILVVSHISFLNYRFCLYYASGQLNHH